MIKKNSEPQSERPTIIDIPPEDVIDVDQSTDFAKPKFDEYVIPESPKVAVKKSSSVWPIAAGALALGLIGGGWAYKDLLSGYFPNDAVKSLESRLAALEGGAQSGAELQAVQDRVVGQLTTDVDAMEATLGQNQSQALELTSKLDTGFASQGQKISVLEKTVSDVGVEITKLKSLPLATSTSGGSVDPSILASLGSRIDALEKDLASLKTARAGSEDHTVLTQSLSDLKAKLASGVTYASELTRVKTLVPAAEGFEDLERFAATGIPTVWGLAAELRAAAPSFPLPVAVAVSSDDRYFASIRNFFSGLVTIKNVGEENWQALAEKIAGVAETGNLSEAVAMMDKASGAKPAAFNAWREKASARISADQAIGLVSDAVTRHLLAKGL